MKIMQKLWGFSFQSNQPASLVGENKHFKTLWSLFFFELFSQRFYNYLAGSTDFGNVSFIVPGIHPFFYIGTDAFNHTEEYTEAAGMAALVYRELMQFLLMKVNCIISDIISFQVTWFVCLAFYLLSALYSSFRSFFFFCTRSWKGPVVHPEDSQGPGYDSCRCSVLPCCAEASERGLQAGQNETGELTKRQ